MNTHTGQITLVVCSLILSGFAVLQQNVLEDRADKIHFQERRLTETRHALKMEIHTSERLKVQKAHLEEKIIRLGERESRLRKELSKQIAYSRELERKVRSQMKVLAEIEGKINWLKKSESDHKARIAELISEKTQLINQLKELDSEKAELSAKLEENRKAGAKAAKEQARLERIRKITSRTKVRLENFAIRKKPHRAEIQMVRPGEDVWKYTWFRFSLENQDAGILKGRTFMLKLVEPETGDVLSYNEYNPLFPESDQNLQGVPFVFEGSPTELIHKNTQVKQGQHYDMQLFYLEDGKEYLIEQSIRPVIKFGKPFSL